MKRELGRTPAALPVLLLVMLIGPFAPRAQALMVGQAPDSPAARVNPNSDTTWSGVGSVVVNGAPLSGVVIAGRFVLTAAHVVNGQPTSALKFVLNLGATQWTSAVESVAIHPTFSFPYDDLAVLKLANPVPPSVPIYRMYTGAQVTGLILTLVGYGASGNGDTGVSVGASSAVKRIGENVVDALQSTIDTSGHTSRFLLYDFDGPAGNGSLGGPTLGDTLETVVAEGDSGSPVFVHNGSTPQIFGISNFVSAPNGGTVTYEFGTVGGGIIASDSRFSAWLQTATEGTLGSPAQVDVPLPPWSGVVLAFVLVALSMRYANSAALPIARKLIPPSWTKSAQNTRGE